ncbi:DUF1570 domain-containing protein [Planctomicrobium sp. SH661]|uniref:DUF1570 domain-containing protein n=1 Tax=Planctomicrobium sp. SH661 TaxID=3448124 RepID=UPI003F5BC717
MFQRFPWLCLLLCFALPGRLPADEFTYVNEQGNEITLQARLIGSGQGFQALERTDGQIRIVPTAAIQNRENTGDPAPVDCDEMATRLREIFTPELTRIEIQKPVVVAMVLAAPLDKSAEGHAATFIKKAARFMNNVDGVFNKYASFMHFPVRELRFPLVLVIFESDADFEKYANEATGGRSLSASSITGFYSGLTNWLAVRMSACDSFEVPLHEAIHQQMYNRVLQRLAPIPKWFDEGIATGFEGNGERIDSNPAKVNSRYARLAMRLPPGTQWSALIGNDASFSADVLAGDAYTLAWCLHWMLATQHRENYQKFVTHLSERAPLSEKNPDDELNRFAEIFGADMNQLQSQFPQALQLATKRQKVNLADPPPGNASSQQALGQYSIDAISVANLGGQLQVGGFLRNISPLRAMTFYVTVETEGGMYADWLVPDLKPTQKQVLPKQVVTKMVSRKEVGSSRQYRVFIRSVPAASQEAAAWKSGKLPPPVTSDE